MAFSRKKGRPKSNKTKQDYGTPELQKKRKLGFTIEPLDLCLNNKLISQDEHSAGIRLRWLYTLRYGSPDIGAYNHKEMQIGTRRSDDEMWLQARGLEFESAIKELITIKAKRIVMNICIFNQRVSFLTPIKEGISKQELLYRKKQFDIFKDGMQLLEKNLNNKNY